MNFEDNLYGTTEITGLGQPDYVKWLSKSVQQPVQTTQTPVIQSPMEQSTMDLDHIIKTLNDKYIKISVSSMVIFLIGILSGVVLSRALYGGR